MITLGADDLEERLAATLEAEAKRGWEDGARRVTQRELNDAQEALERLRQTVDPIRKGQALWTTRQRTRRPLEALVDPEWKALLDPEIPLRTDRAEIDRLREQAAALASSADQRGLSRLIKRGARDEALSDLARSLERIVASIPRDKRMHVPVSVKKMAEAPDAPAQFLRFLEALGPDPGLPPRDRCRTASAGRGRARADGQHSRRPIDRGPGTRRRNLARTVP